MGIKELKEMCCQANLELARKGTGGLHLGKRFPIGPGKGYFRHQAQRRAL